MKKWYLAAAAVMTIAEAMLLGCSAKPLAVQKNVQEGIVSYIEKAPTDFVTMAQPDAKPLRMVMLDGRLYVETNETNSMLRCGVMDGTITSTTDGAVPTEDGQSNFGKDIGFQYGMRMNRIEICIDGIWHIFAYNENNLDGVSMKVSNVEKTGCTVTMVNESKREITFGEDYLLEKLDAETGEWISVPIVVDGKWGYNDIGYPVSAEETRDWEVDWTWLYGEPAPGNYRIVKSVLSEEKSEGMRTEGSGTNVKYTLFCEFTIE